MKKILKNFIVFSLVFTMGAVILASCGVVSPIFVTLHGYEVEADKRTGDDFDWAGWYKLNGVGSVVGLIEAGQISKEEALELIMRPACDAGYVTDNQKNLL